MDRSHGADPTSRDPESEGDVARRGVTESPWPKGFVGGAAMRATFDLLARAASASAPVLVLGESGTGKELSARAIHRASPRRDGPFEVVDCGALAPTLIEAELFGHERGAFTGAVGEREGAFERADGGTLFLDELGELPLEVQPKLLRALGEGEVRRVGGKRARKVDVRVVAATHRDLRRAVGEGRFRADLFFRLAVLEVRLPPLRERLDDLDALVESLTRAVAGERGVRRVPPLSATEWASLRAHAWPGNVRELRNWVEQRLVLGHAALAPGEAARGEPDPARTDRTWREVKREALDRVEARYVAALLRETGGNVCEAARRAEVDRSTITRAIERHGLDRWAPG